jgi:hypothetical protein
MTENKNTALYVTGALAGAAMLGSAYMYNRIQNLEAEIKAKNEQFDKVIKQLEDNTKLLGEGSTVEAKMQNIQSTLKSLEHLMYQQTGQI